MMTDVVIRAKYGSGSVDIRITDQDELKVSSGGIAIASWSAPQGNPFVDGDAEEAMASQCTGSKCAGWTGTKAYGGSGTATEGGSPNIVTVKRLGAAWKRSIAWKWKVEFAFGGAITIWATKTAEDKRRRRVAQAENVMLWMWLQIPMGLQIPSAGSGLCATACNDNVALPYEWCQGNTECLPVKAEDTVVWTTSEITALETGCRITAGTSQRPNTCIDRPVTDVDCGQTRKASGGFYNEYKKFKWPKNLGIYNNRNSGGTGSTGDVGSWSSNGCGGSGCTRETYTGVYGFNDQAQDSASNNQDGFCDAGVFCGDGPSCEPTYPGGPGNCCQRRNPGGGGGAAEDQDCPYDYEFRDFAPEYPAFRGGFPDVTARHLNSSDPRICKSCSDLPCAPALSGRKLSSKI